MRGLIVGLPRSRTAWLSAMLSTAHMDVTHEYIHGHTESDYITRSLDHDWIDCTTWHHAPGYVGDTLKLYVRRRVDKVHASLERMGWGGVFSEAQLVEFDKLMCRTVDEVIPHEDLDGCLPHIFEGFGLRYNSNLHANFKRLNIQTQTTRSRYDGRT